MHTTNYVCSLRNAFTQKTFFSLYFVKKDVKEVMASKKDKSEAKKGAKKGIKKGEKAAKKKMMTRREVQ